MDRREVLKTGLLAAFLPFGWVNGKTNSVAGLYYSPNCPELGIAKQVTLSVDYHYIDDYRDYLIFPIEVIINVTYEHGYEQWQGFNVKNSHLKRFSIDRFFSGSFENDPVDNYGCIVKIDNMKYRLISIGFEYNIGNKE